MVKKINKTFRNRLQTFVYTLPSVGLCMNAFKAESPLSSHGNNIPVLGNQVCKMTEIENKLF
jgi:hypothetical protein